VGGSQKRDDEPKVKRWRPEPRADHGGYVKMTGPRGGGESRGGKKHNGLEKKAKETKRRLANIKNAKKVTPNGLNRSARNEAREN